MNDTNRQTRSWRPLAALLLATGGLIFLYGQIEYLVEPYASWDLYHYRQITAAAPQLTGAVQQPFAFRLLGPYLAGLLPLPDAAAYGLLTVVAALALAGLTYRFFLASNLTPTAAALAVFLFVCNKHLFGFLVWDFFALNDTLTLIFLVILLWALQQQRWPLFALAFALSLAARETALILLPTALVFLLERPAPQPAPGRLFAMHGRALVLAALPGLLIFGLIRLFVEHTGGLGLFEQLARTAPKLLLPETWLRLLINAFLPVSFLPLIYWRQVIAFLHSRRYLLVYLALVLASAAFGYDNERLMAPAAPVFYLIIGLILDHALAQQRQQRWLFAVAGIAASFQHLIGRFPLPSSAWTMILSLGATLFVTLLALRSQRSSPARLLLHPGL